MRQTVTIGVDTGNSCIKTANFIFVAGVVESDAPIKGGSDVIRYEGVYYQANNKRLTYRDDKTIDMKYFALTLMAIAKELKKREYITGGDNVIEVKLALGLPPQHIQALGKSFRKHFDKGRITFTYNNENITIDIRKVYIFPQGYAAVAGYMDDIKDFNQAYIVDIGGYTTDVLRICNGQLQPDTLKSLDKGMIHLYDNIIEAIKTKTRKTVSETAINEFLCGGKMSVNKRFLVGKDDYTDLVKEKLSEFAKSLVLELNERQIDLTIETGIFIGGGSAVLRPYLNDLCDVYFIDDIHANAKGYELLANGVQQKEQGYNE